MVQGLRVLGVDTVGQLSAMPRAPLTLRFGPEPGRRLDQMFGRIAEPIDPIRTPDLVEVSRNFSEPIGAAETIAKYTRRLVVQLTARLEERGLGVRRCDLIIHRVDNIMQCLRAGLAKPVREPARLSNSSATASRRSILASESRRWRSLPLWSNRWRRSKSPPL
ncbi:hypothetical protein AJ87_35375 [Rhizobium yanglingense]|nr:hypothetical protein AJ87_35375 [Rhizobium yanglingense]